MASDSEIRRGEGGWTVAEVLFATAAAVGIAAVGAYAFSGAAERSEARTKAAAAAIEIAAFESRDGRVEVRPLPDGLELLQACGVDSGDSSIPGAGSTVHCVDPAVNATASIVAASDACSGTMQQRLNDVFANYRAGLSRPTMTEVLQGIWVPADSEAEARAIAHLVQRGLNAMDGHHLRVPKDLTVSATGVLICL